MIFDLKKVTCCVVTLLLLLVCHSVGYPQQISKTVNYNTTFQPFGDGIHKEYPLPAEVDDPDNYFQILFNVDLTPEDITAEITGTITFDQENGTLQMRGADGKLQSEGGISFGGIIKIAIKLPPIPAFIAEPILLKTEIPFSISNLLSESYLKSGPISINVLEPWHVFASFETFHLNGNPIEVRGGIRDLVRLELTAVNIASLILTALTSGALPPPVTNLLGIAFDKGIGNAGISYNLGFLSTATLTGKSITVNGQQITSENQIISAPGLDLSQSSYTVNSSYEERFTYQLDYVVSSDVRLKFNPLGISVWDYEKVIFERDLPIIEKQEVDLNFTSAQTTFPIVKAETVEPPIAVNTIPTQNLTVPGPSRPVDVAPYFSSQSDLIYEADSKPRGIVDPSVSGSRVTIKPLQKGSTSVVITAFDRDDRNLSAIQTIPVTVRPNSATIVRPPSDPTFTQPTTSNPVVEGLDDGVEIIVHNMGTVGLNIRSNPWVSNANPDNRIGKVYDGATGRITDGPERNGGFTWWKIDWDHRESDSDWSAEADRGQILFRRPPDLEIRSFNVSDDEVEPGETFTIEATVQNNGPGESAPTEIFFYYQKSDEDTSRVAGRGKLNVPSLRARRSSPKRTLTVEAPMIPGDYKYSAILPPDIPDTYNKDLVKLLDPMEKIDLNNTDHEDVEVTSSPDLIVESISANKSTVDPGEEFRLEAVVRNQGIGKPARRATLGYYLSDDANITKSDTPVGEDRISEEDLDPDGITKGTATRTESIPAPIEPGVYYYGAYVDLRFERNTRNNASSAIAITVRDTGPSDLFVSTPTLSANTLAPGESLTLTTTVQNQGTGPAPATTLRVHRSSNANISNVDTKVGDVFSIGYLRPTNTQTAQIRIEIPLAAGTYYYGVCVDDVANESNTVNNCSTGVALTVENLAPVAADTLTAQTLVIGEASLLDMAPYFSDPNEDTLTYQPSSSSVEIVAVEMSGLSASHLRMNPLAAGTATVTVEATDASGLRFSQTFSVTVNPPPNRAPVAIGTISPETLMARGASKVVDVSGLFHDLDGDTLRYTASSDDKRVLSTNVSERQITLFPLREGSVSVTVTASDGELTATLPIAVSVTPYMGAETWMPDASLRAAVRTALGLAPDDVLTQQAMEGLIILNAASSTAGTGVQDLTGLEYATQLSILNLGRSGVSDLTPLQGLTQLTQLNLIYTEIWDLSPIQGLTNLTNLNLLQTDARNITPLQGLINLTSLNLERVGIRDLTPLQGLTGLTSLNLSFNNANNFINPGDLTPLSGLTALTSLNLGHTTISDITPLKGLTALTDLDLKNNEISDISSLSGLTQLVRLYLDGNQISDVSPLEGLTSLQLLRLKYNPIADTAPLQRLKANNPNVSIDVNIETQAPDLFVDSVSVNINTVSPGEKFRLDTVVRNQGEADSAATPLRYYRSIDNIISTTDTEVRATILPIVAVDATDELSTELTAPDTLGVYYYGICIDAVEGESNTTNNCSTSVAITVENSVPRAVGTIPPQTLSENDPPTVVDVAAYFSNPNNITLIYVAVSDDTAVVLAEMQGSELTLTPVGAGNTTVSVAVSDGALTATQVLSVSVTEIETEGADLVVDAVSVNKNTVAPGETFRLDAVVKNQGEADASNITLRYYQSTDAMISETDTQLKTSTLGLIEVDAMKEPWAQLTAPETPGVYYYGICVDAVANESDTANNCSTAVVVTVLGADLRVASVRVNTTTTSLGDQSRLTAGVKDRGGTDSLDTTDRSAPSTIAPSDQFQLDVSIQNRGKADSTATMLRYYLSSDETISSEDMEIHTATLPSIAADAMREPSVQLTAPDAPGVYYYGVCVDAVDGESNTNNNCSIAVAVTVEGTGSIDFVVESVRASKTTVKPGENFQISAVIHNQGEIDATATPIRYYLSTDEDISTADTEMHTATLPVIAADTTRQQSRQFTAPTTPGTYYYGVCIDTIAGESDANDNCSTAVAVTVGGADLMIDGTPQISKTTLSPSETFQMDTRVWNAGNATSDATTLRYYLSTDDTISSDDTEVDSDNVATLSGKGAHASRRRAELSKTLTAPDTPGDYYYGVCVDSVAGDANIANNCSQAIAITVEAPPEPLVSPVTEGSENLETVEIQGPDLIISAVRVDASTIKIGGGVRFHLTLTNQGTSKAPATIIRYYRSSDATITAEDTELRAVPVGELGSGKSYTTWALLPSAFSVGTYYYGACLDGVASEFDTANNCSDALEIIMVLQSDPIDGLESRGRIPPQTLKVEDSPEALSASRYFAGRVETWEVSSSKPAVVTVSMAADSDVVTLTPVSRGQSVVTVTARLGDTTAQQTFDVYVGIDPTLVLRWAIPVSPQTLEIGGSPVVLNLSGNVSGQVETWKASSSNEAFVAASMTGSVVTLTPVSEGTAEVTIHVSDGTVEVQHTFRVFVGAAGAPDLQWVIPVSPQTLEEGGSPIVLDVSGNVAGEVETWEASSSNDAFVAVSLSGSVVTLTPVSIGSSDVTIRASREDLTVESTFAVSVTPDTSPEVSIPDANLRAAVRSALGLEEGDTLTQRQMARLAPLTNFNSKGINDLTGLEHAANVRNLHLYSNKISDITPLANLTNLTGLHLYNNQISDITPLANLTNLTELDLRESPINDFTPLGNLTALTRLLLDGTQISDLTPLANLTALKTLYLNRNQISDVTPLANLTGLNSLQITMNQISDVTPFPNMTGLTHLGLARNPISDLTPLQNMTGLTSLVLSENPISDLTPLQNLTKLTYLNINWNQISDITPLAGLTALIRLRLEANQITDVAPLEGLTSLQTLSLSGNPITDLAPLRRLKENNPSVDIDIDINADVQEAPSAPDLPDETALLSNYPNPFNPETWIPYQLAKATDVTLTIYDVRGVVVRRLALGHRPPGFYYSRGRAAHWDGRNTLGEKVASGLYFYKFTAGDFTATQKLLIRK